MVSSNFDFKSCIVDQLYKDAKEKVVDLLSGKTQQDKKKQKTQQQSN